MADRLVQLIDKDGNNVFPVTSADSPVITVTNVDPGAGSPLAANNFVAVYGSSDGAITSNDIQDGAVTQSKIDWSSLGSVIVRSASSSQTQSIPSGSETVVNFPVSERTSSAISYSSGTFTVNKTGLYFISAEVGGISGPLTTEIIVNNSEYMSNRSYVSNGVAYVSVSGVAYIASGQTFQIKAYQTSGSALTINSRAKANMNACLIRPV